MGANLPRRRRPPAAKELVQRSDGGEARLWHLGTALAVSFTVAVVGLAGLAWLAWTLLGVAGYRHHGAPALKDTVSVLQLVFATVAGAGALVALIVAYRRQKVTEADSVHDRTRVFNERFTTIATQLGADQPAVQLAGVHAMAGLADDWKQNRQTCVNVLCAYLRLPYDPAPGDNAAAAVRAAYRANREVRHTIIRLIGTHLRPGAVVSWQGLNFDFNGVIFDGGDFRDAEFSGGLAVFDGAEFSSGTVRFTRAKFSGGEVFFGGARFSGGEVDFHDTEFSGGTVSFRYTELSSGTVRFGGARFSGGNVSFYKARFPSGTVDFGGARFSGGEIDFHDAEFSGGTVSFGGARFSGSRVSFTSAEFSGGEIDFGGARFSGSRVSFTSAEFSGGQVSFTSAEFSGGEVDFAGSVFSGAKVDFRGAEFSGGEIDFGGGKFRGGTVRFDGLAGFSGSRVSFLLAEFSGGTVDFSGAGRWSHPPMFSWDGKPPTGVVLPVHHARGRKGQL